MSRPPKPFSVIQAENKSHRTKAELAARQAGEESLLTGVELKERPEVKKNKVAHEEFIRLYDLLQSIGKNDAIYETIINRYCLIQGECAALEKRKAKMIKTAEKLEKKIAELDDFDDFQATRDAARSIADIYKTIGNCDKLIASKRKMLFDIEKENIMTIAAALRSIPKKEEKASNPLLEALK